MFFDTKSLKRNQRCLHILKQAGDPGCLQMEGSLHTNDSGSNDQMAKSTCQILGGNHTFTCFSSQKKLPKQHVYSTQNRKQRIQACFYIFNQALNCGS